MPTALPIAYPLDDFYAQQGMVLPRIEAVSFVNPKAVPRMAGAADVMAGITRRPGVLYAGLILNGRGLDDAIAAEYRSRTAEFTTPDLRGLSQLFFPNEEEAIAARNWTYFPPLGRRSNGGGQAFGGAMWGSVPGGYRATFNDNVVLIVMIETLEGVKNAAEIAKVPGVTALFAASGDLGNFSGYAQGSPDYERLINAVHDAAIGAGKRLCGPFAWRDRPDFTCFQAGSETAAIARGVQAELGTLTNTQGKVEVGPLAAPAGR